MRKPLEIDGIGHLHFVDNYDGGIYKVLILDDDPAVLSSVKDFLILRGIDQVDIVYTISEAAEKIELTKYDAILADVLLYDPKDKSSDLVRGDQWLLRQREKLENVFKAAVTGFPDRITNISALKRSGIGVIVKGDAAEMDLYDELVRRAQEKKYRLEGQLSEMVRSIIKAVEEGVGDSSIHADPSGKFLAQDLQAKILKLSLQKNPQAKGRDLERLAADMFSRIPGISVVDRNRRLVGEEFDLVLENNIEGTFWASLHSPFFLVECKNERKKTGAPDVAKFWAKLVKHRNLARFGFLLSSAGFSRGALTELRRYGAMDISVALIDIDDIHAMCENPERGEDWLKKVILRSLL
jgi:DNA-binding NarL/FixJ family response regulator